MDVRIERNQSPKPKPDPNNLEFGKLFTDHMFLLDYQEGKGWHNARIVPYGPLSLDPAATCLHYGQLVFEGMKAYKAEDGSVVLFRPDENMKRLNESNDRLCIPQIDEEQVLEGIMRLVDLERDWIPDAPGTSLYVRPYILSTEAFLGVHPSTQYLLAVITCPVGAYYKGGLSPIKIYVENKYVRAVKGGTGFTKCAGNYAASLRSQVEAGELGYEQVLWLDGVERKNIEEVGAMNVFFVIDGKAVTPALNGSILSGITRKSVIHILKDWGIPVEERTLSIDEVHQAHKEGRLQEAFGTGTAAVISPMGELRWGDEVMVINDNKIGELSQRLYDEISGIQSCARQDKYGWVFQVKKQ